MLPNDWLHRPTVQFREEEGATTALVRLRAAPPAYSIQPNPECLVFFHLGADHWPVSVEFLEPVPGRLVFKVLTRLMEGPSGEPAGVSVEPAHRFIPLSPEELVAVLRAMDEAQEGLEASAAR